MHIFGAKAVILIWQDAHLHRYNDKGVLPYPTYKSYFVSITRRKFQGINFRKLQNAQFIILNS